jgi:hypothetical protein
MGTISSISEVIKNKKGFQRKKSATLLSTHTLVKPRADMSDPDEREKAMKKAEAIKAENKKPILDEKEELNQDDEKEELNQDDEKEELNQDDEKEELNQDDEKEDTEE